MLSFQFTHNHPTSLTQRDHANHASSSISPCRLQDRKGRTACCFTGKTTISVSPPIPTRLYRLESMNIVFDTPTPTLHRTIFIISSFTFSPNKGKGIIRVHTGCRSPVALHRALSWIRARPRPSQSIHMSEYPHYYNNI